MCSVLKGDMPINIFWLFNNQSLTPSDELSISQSGKRTITLAIESVKGHHAGMYSCVGRNDAGQDVHSAELLVNGWLWSNSKDCMVFIYLFSLLQLYA